MGKIFKKVYSILFPMIFFAAGIGLIFLGFGNIRDRRIYTETTAVISNISYVEDERGGHYEVLVKYSVDGNEYEAALGQYNTGMSVGQEVAIMYDPGDPNSIKAAGNASSTMYFVAGFVAILLAAAGGYRVMKGY